MTMKYRMYFEEDGFSVGKKISSKPYKSLCEPPKQPFFLDIYVMIVGRFPIG